MYRIEIHGTLSSRVALLVITKLALNKGISSNLDISLPAQIEAVLYLKGKPLSIAEISEILNQSKEHVQEALFALMAGYSQRDTALEVKEKDGKYSLQLRQGLGELVKSLLPVDISGATLRTLGTIALKKRILAIKGKGVWLNNKPLKPESRFKKNSDCISLCSRSIKVLQMKPEQSFPGKIRLLGVSSLNMTSVAICLLYTSPSPRDDTLSRKPSSA